MITRRTKTYIAGDWDNDIGAIDKLYEWKNNGWLALDFYDAHEVTQARDTSLCCSIKKSLRERLDLSHTFVLVVGNQTNKLTKGSCRYCNSYDSYHQTCHRRNTVDFRSYIQYECDTAQKDNMRIIVLYNSEFVNKSLCPEIFRNYIDHVPMLIRKNDNKLYWNYESVRKALMGR